MLLRTLISMQSLLAEEHIHAQYTTVAAQEGSLKIFTDKVTHPENVFRFRICRQESENVSVRSKQVGIVGTALGLEDCKALEEQTVCRHPELQ